MGDGDRSIRVNDLLSLHEIAIFLGVSALDVRSLVAGHHGFPAPAVVRGEHGEVQLWARGDVASWWSAHSVLSGSELLGDVVAASREVLAIGFGDLLTAKEVSELLGWSSPSTPWDLSKKGTFPAPVRRHGRTKLWDRSEVEHWGRTAPRRRGPSKHTAP